jgi:hypothetical protein
VAFGFKGIILGVSGIGGNDGISWVCWLAVTIDTNADMAIMATTAQITR